MRAMPPGVGPARATRRPSPRRDVLASESEALTCGAVELRSSAIRLRCGFASNASCRLAASARKHSHCPPIESAADIAAAMKAVTSALAGGAITPGEAERIAAMVDTFVRAIDAGDFDRRLQELEDASKARCGLHCRSRGRPGSTTDRRVFAADLLQVQQRETIGSILDSKSRPWPLAGRHAFCDHSRRDGGRRP
jgi:hypothetical protein